VERASEVVRKIARSEKINMLGLCAGGITLCYVLAHLAAIGDESANSASFVVTMLTGEKPNVVGMLDTNQAQTLMEAAAGCEQTVPGTALRTLFAMLRPNDLVFNYLVRQPARMTARTKVPGGRPRRPLSAQSLTPSVNSEGI
jgi:polyhydroxyalkanoate synthase